MISGIKSFRTSENNYVNSNTKTGLNNRSCIKSSPIKNSFTSNKSSSGKIGKILKSFVAAFTSIIAFFSKLFSKKSTTTDIPIKTDSPKTEGPKRKEKPAETRTSGTPKTTIPKEKPKTEQDGEQDTVVTIDTEAIDEDKKTDTKADKDEKVDKEENAKENAKPEADIFDSGILKTDITKCSEEEYQKFLENIYSLCPDFKQILSNDEKSAKNLLESVKSIVECDTFKALSKSEKKVLLSAFLLQDIECERKEVRIFRNAFYVAKFGNDENKTLNFDERRTISILIFTLNMLKQGKNIDDFPILKEKENEMLKLIVDFHPQKAELKPQLPKLIERNTKIMELSDKHSQLVYSTPFDTEKALENANCVMKQRYPSSDRWYGAEEKNNYNKTLGIPTIDLTKISDDEDVSKFGFPKGTKKKDLKFYVYMVEDRGMCRSNILKQNLDELLTSIDNYDLLWSKSLISPDYQKTFMDRHYGVITKPKIGQMHSALIDGYATGYIKKLSRKLPSMLNNTETPQRLTMLPNIVKEELKLTDDEYTALAKKLESMENIFSDEYNESKISFANKTITISDLRKTMEKVADKLFQTVETRNNSENNEVVDETCDILGVIIKSTEGYQPYYIESFDDNNKCLVDFINKFEEKTGRKLPIIMI